MKKAGRVVFTVGFYSFKIHIKLAFYHTVVKLSAFVGFSPKKLLKLFMWGNNKSRGVI